MSFMGDDERLLLMDCPIKMEDPLVRLPEEDIRKLVDAGIKTAMLFYVDWGLIEPEIGKRDFQHFDDRVDLLNRCGMKVLFQCFTRIPEWVPDDWLIRGPTGATHRMISPWNDEALSYALDFVGDLHKRYTVPGMSMTVNSWLTDGETLFPNELCIYDEHALKRFVEIYGSLPAVNADVAKVEFLHDAQLDLIWKLQKIHYQNVDKEIWHAFHPALAGYQGNGCDIIEPILVQYKAAFPDAIINHLYCTWIQWASYWPLMETWRDVFGERIWGGAEYAEGVVGNTISAKSRGIRGLLIGPCHPFTGHTRIEDWMLVNIKEAMRLWANP